jgi:BirA family biotin operon repressor/biotin-[acetyl-CoA-carboxylase] ligase
MTRAEDLLSEDALRAALPMGHRFGSVLEMHPVVGSTSDIARALAQAGAPEGTTVVADAQNAGRGRQGRSWFSPPERNLYLSVVLRPPLAPPQAPILTFATAVALADAVREVGFLEPALKWPNDLLLAGRKAAGILTEMSATEHVVDWVVVGIGINVNLAEDEIPRELAEQATSLRIEAGHSVSRPVLFGTLLTGLERQVRRCYAEGAAPILQSWRRCSATLGREVQIDENGTRVEGRAVDLDERGALLVETAHGIVRVIAGDVRHRA